MAADDELAYQGLTEVAARIESRELSPLDLVRSTLDRIARFDGELHCYLELLGESAMDEAAAHEREIAAGGYRGPLHGVPVGIKDLFPVAGAPLTCASRVLRGNVAAADCSVVARLRSAGAIVIGMLGMTEFAYGGYHPEVAAPWNPWGRGRWPGLSSSGSGAATAAGLCYAALGTDTGGSIRYPAAANGVVGIKPTYGRVSRHGVFPLSHTLDHVGPLARSVADAATVLGVIAGADPLDPTSASRSVPDYAAELGRELRGVRVGIDRGYCSAGVEAEVSTAVCEAANVLAGAGAIVEELTVPSLDAALSAWLTICAVDAALAHESTYPGREADYGPLFGSILASAQEIDARSYAQAMVERSAVGAAVARIFDEVDVLLCPALACEAPQVEERSDETPVVGTSFAFTAPYNLSGSPSLTMPCGVSRSGMPLALQLVGRRFDEATLVRVGDAYEAATEWGEHHPSLDWCSPSPRSV